MILNGADRDPSSSTVPVSSWCSGQWNSQVRSALGELLVPAVLASWRLLEVAGQASRMGQQVTQRDLRAMVGAAGRLRQ